MMLDLQSFIEVSLKSLGCGASFMVLIVLVTQMMMAVEELQLMATQNE